MAEKLKVPVDETAGATIKLEQKTVRGWRADVEIQWAGGVTKTRLELKLTAGLTRRQIEAAEENFIDGMVVPSGGSKPRYETAVFSWRELAGIVENVTVRQLFMDADTAASWVVQELDEVTLRSEFSCCMKGGAEARWPKLYWFLITIHQHISESGLDRYVSGSCRESRAAGHGYYGYGFTLGESKAKHWLGFSEMGGQLTFVLVDEKANSRIFAEPTFPLQAASLSERIVQALAPAKSVTGP